MRDYAAYVLDVASDTDCGHDLETIDEPVNQMSDWCRAMLIQELPRDVVGPSD